MNQENHEEKTILEQTNTPENEDHSLKEENKKSVDIVSQQDFPDENNSEINHNEYAAKEVSVESEQSDLTGSESIELNITEKDDGTDTEKKEKGKKETATIYKECTKETTQEECEKEPSTSDVEIQNDIHSDVNQADENLAVAEAVTKEGNHSDSVEPHSQAGEEKPISVIEDKQKSDEEGATPEKSDHPLTIEEKRRKQLENKLTIEEKRKQQKQAVVDENHKPSIIESVKQMNLIDQAFLGLLLLCEFMNVYVSLQILRYTRLLYAVLFFLVFSIIIIGGFLLMVKHRKAGIICSTLLSVILVGCTVGCYRVSQFTNTVFHGTESETVMIVARKDSSLSASSDFTGLKIAFVKSDIASNTFAENILENEAKTGYIKIESQTHQEAYEHLMDHTVDLMVYTMQTRSILEEYDIDSWSHVKVILEGKRGLEAVKSKDVDITKDPFNVLISGVDLSSSGINEKGNSDVNIILSVNPKTKKIIMQTIPRDSWAPLACYDHKHTKLTYAGRNGGIDCSIKTIEEMFDITIHYYAKINFQGVMDLVDAFGGITIYNDIAFCTPYQDRYGNSLDVCFQAGENRIDGSQALIYSRVRKIFSDGDIERGRHQMAVINGVIREFQKAPTLSNINSLFGAVEDNFTTNFDEDDIGKALELLLSMQGKLTNIEAYTMEGEMLWDTDEITNEYLYYFYPYDGQVELFQQRIQDVMEGE